jgi:hypothetical protein
VARPHQLSLLVPMIEAWVSLNGGMGYRYAPRRRTFGEVR